MSKSPDDKNLDTAKAIMTQMVATPHKPHKTKKSAKRKLAKTRPKSG